MASTRHKWTDGEILHVLDMKQEGHSAANIAEAMSARVGVRFRKNQIIGQIAKCEEDIACECEKPENKDGGMPEGWWRQGLKGEELQ